MAESGYDMAKERGKRRELTKKELKEMKEEEYKRIYGLTVEDKLDKIIDSLSSIEFAIRKY